MKALFANQQGVRYVGEVTEGALSIEKDRVLKLRSVDLIEKDSENLVIFHEYSSILVLPSHFLTSKEMREKISSSEISEDFLRKNFSGNFQLQKFKEEKIGPHTFVYLTKDL